MTLQSVFHLLWCHREVKLVLVPQSRPTLCDPMACSPSHSSVHGILQARWLEWVTIPFSKRSSQPTNQSRVSCIAGRFFFFYHLSHQGSPNWRPGNLRCKTPRWWGSCTPREKGFRHIGFKKLLGRPAWFTGCPWFRILEPQRNCLRKKIRRREIRGGCWGVVQMQAIICELWKGGPSKPEGELPLRLLLCAPWLPSHSGEHPGDFRISVAPGARWPSQGRSTEAAPPASPNWSPTFEGSRTTLPGRGQRVCIGESGPEANSRAPSVSPLRYQISAFNGDDSACC